MTTLETFTQSVANDCLYSAMLAASDGYGMTGWQGKVNEPEDETPVVFYNC